MPFDFHNFLILAEHLANRNDEASKRTAISRAYYSVYHLAFERAQRTVGPFPKNAGKGNHQWCWDQYTTTPDLTSRRLGTHGDRMKRLRVKADYKKDDIRRIDDEVQRVLQDARQFSADILALDPRYPRP